MRGSAPTYDLYGESHTQRPDFWLHWETIASRSQLHNWEIKTHKHDAFFQILYLRGGTGDAVFNGEVHPILPPVMIAVPPNMSMDSGSQKIWTGWSSPWWLRAWVPWAALSSTRK